MCFPPNSSVSSVRPAPDSDRTVWWFPGSEGGGYGCSEAVGGLDHRIVADAVEDRHVRVGAGAAQLGGHRYHGDRIVRAPHDRERRRMGLDGVGEPPFFGAPVFDVAN